MNQPTALILVHGSYYRMEKTQTVEELFDENGCMNILDCFENSCVELGHLFDVEPEKDILSKQPKDDLYKWCIACESLIKFWKYSPDMIDAIKSKVMCC